MYSYDPDEPDDTYATARVTATGPVATQFARIDSGPDPTWYTPPSRTLGGLSQMTTEYQHTLVLSRDGSRIATPTQAWNVATGEYIRVAAVDSWYGSSFSRSAGDYVPVSIAYDAGHELMRVSTGNRYWYVEPCHESSPNIDLPRALTGAAMVPGSRRIVMAFADDVRLDDRVLVSTPAKAIACAADGSAIAVAAAERATIFDNAGTELVTLPLPSTTGLAVARNGVAIACIDRGELAIIRATGVVRAANAGQAAAFSPDGLLVAYATTAWGFAIVDATTAELVRRHQDLSSPVNALAFAPDGSSLYTLGADGRITQWVI
jgi:WD40 repeat protein